MKTIETTAELVKALTINLSTLNLDTREAKPMPAIQPEGEEGIQGFIREMRERDLAPLAEAVAFAHRVESSRHTNGFSIADIRQVLTNLRVMGDFRFTVSHNLSLLNAPATGLVGVGYRTGVSIGDMIVTLYNEGLGAQNMDWQSVESVKYRVHDLSKQTDLKLSPLMESILPTAQSKAA